VVLVVLEQAPPKTAAAAAAAQAGTAAQATRLPTRRAFRTRPLDVVLLEALEALETTLVSARPEAPV
jgi:hypothetical protein